MFGEGEKLGEIDAEIDELALGLFETLGEVLTLGDVLGDKLTLGEVDGEIDGEIDALKDGEADGLTLTLGEVDDEADGLTETEGEVDDDADGEMDGERDALIDVAVCVELPEVQVTVISTVAPVTMVRPLVNLTPCMN